MTLTRPTPAIRTSLSKRYMVRLAKALVPYRGMPIDKQVLDAIARETYNDVVFLRNDYQRLAARAYAVQLGLDQAPSLTQAGSKDYKPIRGLAGYRRSDWRKAVAKALHEHSDDPGNVDNAAIGRLLVRMDLHGRNSERNTMVALSRNDDSIIGWARVDYALPTCPLCSITISRGPVYHSEESAGGQGNDYHGGCTCEIVLVRADEKDSWPGREIYLRELAFYKEHGGSVKRYRKAVKDRNAPHDGATKRAADAVAKAEEEP